MMNPEQTLITRRLSLTPLKHSDTESAFEVYSDPETWQHVPAGRHVSLAQSQRLIDAAIASAQEHGLGQWAVRLTDEGADAHLTSGMFIGTGGVNMTPAQVWNLGYRLSPRAWGRGFATEIALAAFAAAREIGDAIPITARVLSNNPASARVAARAGLRKVWKGPTAATAAPGVYAEVFSDRELSEEALHWLTEHV